MVNSSRPASGEEHHLSHCWEATFMERGKTMNWLHGNTVGIGVVIILEVYKYLKNVDIQKVYEGGAYRYFDKVKWIENLKAVYGKNAENVIEFKENDIAFNEEHREENMRNIMKQWDNIVQICDSFLPQPEEIRNILKEVGTIHNPKDLGIDKEFFKKTLRAAKDLRRRYGVLQLLEDIGILEEVAEEIGNRYYET